MTHETAWQQALRELGDVRKVEIIVGIPTFNNATTIEHVVKTVVAGLDKAFPHASVVIVNSDAGSRDATPEAVKQAVGERLPTVLVQHLATGLQPGPFSLHRLTESGVPGREEAFRVFFGITEELQAKACVVVDANVRSVTPDWMEFLLQPVLEKGADYVAPLFRRPRYEGSLTNSIVYPLNRALYGKRIRCQSGGGYGFSRRLASLYLSKDVWEEEAARFGIDTWLMSVAVAEGHEVCQASLGAKVHDSKLSVVDLSIVLAQAVGAVFHYMEQYQDVWEGRKGSSTVPLIGPPYEPGTETVPINVDRLVKGFRQGLRDLLSIWEIILAPETLADILPLGLVEVEEFRFPMSLWVQTVYDFALAYHEKVLHREHLLKSLTPLYLGRTASLVIETRQGGPQDVEAAIELLCETFESRKPYLIQRWRFQ